MRLISVAAVLFVFWLPFVAWGQARGIEVVVKAGDAPGAAIETVLLYGASHALVIGIDAYTGGWPQLKNAVNDARAVASELDARGFDVTLKIDPKSSEMREALREFFAIKGADPEARLVLWFAGHGYTLGGEGFLVPADAPLPTNPSFKVKALHMRDFEGLVRLAEAKHVLSVFDSCFSGTIFSAKGAPPSPAITRATTKPVRQFITSGDAEQQVTDDTTFRTFFLRALRGEARADANDDGYLTAGELSLYLSDRVTNYTESAQTPRYGKLLDVKYDRGDFVFVLPKIELGSPAPAPVEAPIDLRVWDRIEGSNDPADFATFIERFPSSPMAPFARNKLKALTEVETAVVTPQESEAPTGGASISLELNKVAAKGDVCRLSFVLKNQSDLAFSDFRLQLAFFDSQGEVITDATVDFLQVRRQKTVVRYFDVPDLTCPALAKVLLHDVAACVPPAPRGVDCLDLIHPSARGDVGFYK